METNEEISKEQVPRDRLIDATIESIYQHGYGDTTIAKISELADMALGSVHNHFSDKNDLLEHAMRHLLQTMHSDVIAGCASAASPRAKLWAIIESVLGDKQSEDKTTTVWLSYWVQSEYDEKLRRIRDVYNRRLNANVRTYLRQMLMEIGASNVEERTYSGSIMLTSMMHGVWISYAMKEDLSQDLAHGRLLVWECLEMLLSRAREPLSEDSATVATSAALLEDVSVEVIASDVKKIDEWRQYALKNMPIFIPHFRGALNLSDKVRMATYIKEAGFRPVAHIAARNVRDITELERTVAGLTASGVEEFLLLGGGESDAVGDYDSALKLLQSGILQRYGVKRVGFAGHPEKHPDQPRDIMRKALVEKIAAAKAAKMECYIVTQFCFAARPFFDFLDWAENEKLNVPIRIGIAGRVNAAKLMKFAAACGIGRSLSFLKRQFSKTMHLVNYSPEGLLAEVAARSAVHRYSFPVGVHFYPFGAMANTLALVTAAGLETGSADLSTKEGEINVH